MRYKSNFKNKTADHSLHTLLNARTVGAGADRARYSHMSDGRFGRATPELSAHERRR